MASMPVWLVIIAVTIGKAQFHSFANVSSSSNSSGQNSAVPTIEPAPYGSSNFSFYIPFNQTQPCDIYGPICQTGSITVGVSLAATRTTSSTLACSAYLAAQSTYLSNFENPGQPGANFPFWPPDWTKGFGRSPECRSYAHAYQHKDQLTLSGCPNDAVVSAYQTGKLPSQLPPGVLRRRGFDWWQCCGNCSLNVPQVRLFYFPDPDAASYCAGRKNASTSAGNATHPITKRAQSSVPGATTIVTMGQTFTSPSVYLQLVGSISVTDQCGDEGFGGATLTDPFVAIPSGQLSTYVDPIHFRDGEPWTDPNGIIGGNFVGQEEALKVADLACPTFGLGIGTKDGQPYTTVGPPYLPLIVPPPQVLSLDPLWQKACPGYLSYAEGLKSFAIFDPPRTLVPASAMAPDPAGAPADTPAAPTALPKDPHPTVAVQPAKPPAPDLPGPTDGSKGISDPPSAPKNNDPAPKPGDSGANQVGQQSAPQNDPAPGNNAPISKPSDSRTGPVPQYPAPENDPAPANSNPGSKPAETGAEPNTPNPGQQPDPRPGSSDRQSITKDPTVSNAPNGNPIGPVNPANDSPKGGQSPSVAAGNSPPSPQLPGPGVQHEGPPFSSGPGQQSPSQQGSIQQSPSQQGSSQQVSPQNQGSAPSIGGLIFNAFNGGSQPSNNNLNPSQPVLTIADQSFTPHRTGFQIGDTSILPGSAPITIAGMAISLAPSGGVFAIGSSTVQLANSNGQSAAPTPAINVLTAGAQTFTASPTGFEVGSLSVLPGSSPITILGTPISLAPSGGILAIGSSTTQLASSNGETAALGPAANVFTAGGQTFTANPTGFLVGDSTILPSSATITISGTPISLSPSGILAIGSSSVNLAVPGPTSNPFNVFKAGSEVFAANPSGFQVGGAAITPGGSAVTIAGTAVSLSPSGILVIGSSSFPLDPPTTAAPLILDGLTLTPTPITGSSFTSASAGAVGVVVDGTTITPGAPLTTVGGKAISLGSGGQLVVGTQRTEIASVTAGSGIGTGGGGVLNGSTGTSQILPFQAEAARSKGRGTGWWLMALVMIIGWRII